VGFEDGDLLIGRQTAPLRFVLMIGHIFRSGLVLTQIAEKSIFN
jgi:hypothetical protein